MAVIYLDSSARVERHSKEAGSAWVQSLCDFSAGHEIDTVSVTEVEFTAAITRRGRGRMISAADAAAA